MTWRANLTIHDPPRFLDQEREAEVEPSRPNLPDPQVPGLGYPPSLTSDPTLLISAASGDLIEACERAR
jgi:hypothetical protein